VGDGRVGNTFATGDDDCFLIRYDGVVDRLEKLWIDVIGDPLDVDSNLNRRVGINAVADWSVGRFAVLVLDCEADSAANWNLRSIIKNDEY
jgi:hypothetical protein